MACANDFDCEGSSLCILPEKASWVNASMCSCSWFFGWAGDECEILSTQSMLLLSLAILTALLSTIAIIYVVSLVKDSVFLARQTAWNNANATLFFTSLGVACVLGTSICRVAIILTPSRNVSKLPWSDLEKLHEWTPYEKVFISISVFSTLLAAVSVSISWIDVALKSSKMLPANKASAFADYSVAVYIIGFLMVVAMGTGASYARQDYAVLFVSPFVFGLILLYIYAQHKLIKLLEAIGQVKSESSSAADLSSPTDEAVGRRPSFLPAAVMTTGSSIAKALKKKKGKESKNRYMVLLQKVRITSRYVILSLTALLLVGMAYSVPSSTVGWRDVCTPNLMVCPVSIAEECMLLLLLAVLSPVEYWLYTSAPAKEGRRRANSSKADRSRSSFASPDTASVRRGESFDMSVIKVSDIEQEERPVGLVDQASASRATSL